MRESGLYVDLGPWCYHFFSLKPAEITVVPDTSIKKRVTKKKRTG